MNNHQQQRRQQQQGGGSDTCDVPAARAAPAPAPTMHGVVPPQQQQHQHQQHPQDYYNSPTTVPIMHHHHQHQHQHHHHRRPPLQAPRLIPRNLPFHQSKNSINVKHNMQNKMFGLLKHDWFHVALQLPTAVSLTTLLVIWTLSILIFAGLYMGVDRIEPGINCGLGAALDPINFSGAFAFSLETCTTVGYGLPNSVNAFFSNCPYLQFSIYLQMVWSMLFNAFLFAFFYSRLSKCDTRGTQVLFSKKAIVSVVNGQVRFQVRVYDVDARHPVVEAHVRLYVVAKERPVPRPLRILQPNDELGGMLFLSFPYVVSHHIDKYSRLMTTEQQEREEYNNSSSNGSNKQTTTIRPTIDPSGLFLRQADSATCGREDVICPVCGESYSTLARWARHVRYQQIVERCDNFSPDDPASHLSVTEEQLRWAEKQASASGGTASDSGAVLALLEQLQRHFAREISEVICVVEGIDPLTSGTFQSLQSYCWDNIVWAEDAQFEPCLAADSSGIRVDLDRFHHVYICEPNGDDNDNDNNNNTPKSPFEERTNNKNSNSNVASAKDSRQTGCQIRSHDSFIDSESDRDDDSDDVEEVV